MEIGLKKWPLRAAGPQQVLPPPPGYVEWHKEQLARLFRTPH